MLSQELRVQEIETVARFPSQRRRFSSSGRKAYILGIKLSGRSAHHFRDGRRVLEKGQVYFFHKDDAYSVEIMEPGEVFSVHFTTSLPVQTKTFFAFVSDLDSVIHRLERLEQAFLRQGCCADSLCELYRLISLVSTLTQESALPQNRRMEEARAHMNLHFKEKDCIAQAARICDVTPRRFTDMFRESYHTTPGQYLTQRKLEKAQQYLSMPELSLAQVAELSGFSDVYYFSKVFKEDTGITPGTFRKQL